MGSGVWRWQGQGCGGGGERGGRRCFRRLRDEIIRRKRRQPLRPFRPADRCCLMCACSPPARTCFARAACMCEKIVGATAPFPRARALGRGARHAPTSCCNLCGQPGVKRRGRGRAPRCNARSAERARQSARSGARRRGALRLPRRDMEMRPDGGEGRGGGGSKGRASGHLLSGGTLLYVRLRVGARARAPQPVRTRRDARVRHSAGAARAACPTHPAASAPRCSATARFPSSTR